MNFFISRKLSEKETKEETFSRIVNTNFQDYGQINVNYENGTHFIDMELGKCRFRF